MNTSFYDKLCENADKYNFPQIKWADEFISSIKQNCLDASKCGKTETFVDIPFNFLQKINKYDNIFQQQLMKAFVEYIKHDADLCTFFICFCNGAFDENERKLNPCIKLMWRQKFPRHDPCISLLRAI
jgi:hypothetical protein